MLDPFVADYMSDSEASTEGALSTPLDSSPLVSNPLDVKVADIDSTTDAKRNARYYNNNASAIVVSLLKDNNVYARPLGNIVYLMPTPLTPEADRQRLIRVIKR